MIINIIFISLCFLSQSLFSMDSEANTQEGLLEKTALDRREQNITFFARFLKLVSHPMSQSTDPLAPVKITKKKKPSSADELLKKKKDLADELPQTFSSFEDAKKAQPVVPAKAKDDSEVPNVNSKPIKVLKVLLSPEERKLLSSDEWRKPVTYWKDILRQNDVAKLQNMQSFLKKLDFDLKKVLFDYALVNCTYEPLVFLLGLWAERHVYKDMIDEGQYSVLKYHIDKNILDIGDGAKLILIKHAFDKRSEECLRLFLKSWKTAELINFKYGINGQSVTLLDIANKELEQPKDEATYNQLNKIRELLSN